MRFLEMTIPVVRPDFDTEGGRRSPQLGDYIYPPLMAMRGGWNMKDLLSRDDLVSMAVLANALEGKTSKAPETRFRKAPKGGPVTIVREATVAEAKQAVQDAEWILGRRKELRNA